METSHRHSSCLAWPASAAARFSLFKRKQRRTALVVRREWQARLGGVITFDSATGDHLTMVRPPNGVSLARKIETWMANAQTG